jgi:hypothetical protein
MLLFYINLSIYVNRASGVFYILHIYYFICPQHGDSFVLTAL